jgi:hypothetical protein
MTIAFPVSGNFINYADRFVDPALAFGAGFAEWLGMFLELSQPQKLKFQRLDCCRSVRGHFLLSYRQLLGR